MGLIRSFLYTIQSRSGVEERCSLGARLCAAAFVAACQPQPRSGPLVTQADSLFPGALPDSCLELSGTGWTNAYDTLTQFDTDRPATWSPDNSRLLVSGRDIYYFSPTGKYPDNPLTLLRPFTTDSMISVPVFYTPHAH